MEQVGSNYDELDDAEANEISEFLIETMSFLMETQRPKTPEETETASIPPVEAPIPVGAELLWILAGGQQEAFVNYLRTYPDEALNSLLQNPEMLRSTIDRLERTMPQGERGQQDGIEQAPLDSSNVYGFQYNPSSGYLKVRFQSGAVYGYQGVPPGVFRVFQQGAVPAKTTGQNQYGKWWVGKLPSLGSAFYSLIRMGGYPYTRLS